MNKILFFVLFLCKIEVIFGQIEKDPNFLNFKKEAESCYKVKNYDCCISNYDKALVYAPQNSQIKAKRSDCIKARETERNINVKRIEAERVANEKRLRAEKAEAERIARVNLMKAEKADTDRITAENQLKEQKRKVEEERIANVEKAKQEKEDLQRIAAENNYRAQKAESERLATERKLKEEKEKENQFKNQLYAFNKQKQIFNKKIMVTSGIGLSALAGSYLLDRNFNNKLKRYEIISNQVDPDNDGQILLKEDFDNYISAYNKVEMARKRKSLFITGGSIAILAVAYDSWLLLNKPQYPRRYSFRPSAENLGITLTYTF